VKLVPILLLLGAACATAAQRPPAFDGARALEHARRLVAIGPRPSGSAGLDKTRDYIRQQLASFGLTVTEQPFDARTPLGTIRMVNLRVQLGPAGGRRIVVGGHYDTKLFRDRTFVGANDGGSSAAFLIELARVMKERKPTFPLELLFLDGEEAVVAWEGDDNTYGSRHYVETARRDGSLPQIGAFVLADMIGDRDLRIKRESQSTPWLADIIWRQARLLGRPEFVAEDTPVEDDHIRFLEAGVPAVDVIDFEYPSWHEESDTIDKLSARSFQVVGEVLSAALPEIAKHLRTAPD